MLEHKTNQNGLVFLGNGCRGWGLRKGLECLWTVHWDGKKVSFLEVVPESVNPHSLILWWRCGPNLQGSSEVRSEGHTCFY